VRARGSIALPPRTRRSGLGPRLVRYRNARRGATPERRHNGANLRACRAGASSVGHTSGPERCRASLTRAVDNGSRRAGHGGHHPLEREEAPRSGVRRCWPRSPRLGRPSRQIPGRGSSPQRRGIGAREAPTQPAGRTTGSARRTTPRPSTATDSPGAQAAMSCASLRNRRRRTASAGRPRTAGMASSSPR